MIRLALGLVSMAVVFSGALARGPVSFGANPGEPKTIRLTEKQFKEVISANDGDTIELWLPSSMPYSWVENEEYPTLVKQKLEPAEIREIEKKQRGQDGVTSVGRPGVFAGRYKVKAKSDASTVVKWTYCKFGRLKETEQGLASGQIPKPPEFRPDMKSEDLKAGIVYQMTLQAHPR